MTPWSLMLQKHPLECTVPIQLCRACSSFNSLHTHTHPLLWRSLTIRGCVYCHSEYKVNEPNPLKSVCNNLENLKGKEKENSEMHLSLFPTLWFKNIVWHIGHQSNHNLNRKNYFSNNEWQQHNTKKPEHSSDHLLKVSYLVKALPGLYTALLYSKCFSGEILARALALPLWHHTGPRLDLVCFHYLTFFLDSFPSFLLLPPPLPPH